MHEPQVLESDCDVSNPSRAERKGFEPLVRFYPYAALAKSRAADENPLNLLGNAHVDSPVSSSVSSNPAIAPYTDLARVVELWPLLPPAIRAAILTLANTTATSAPPAGTVSKDDRDRLPPGYEQRADR